MSLNVTYAQHLGVSYNLPNVGTYSYGNGWNGDLDDVIEPCALWSAAGQAQNRPDIDVHLHIGVIVFKFGERITVQFCVPYAAPSRLYIRTKWMSNSWNGWEQL